MKSMICENTVRPRFMFASASRWEASRIGRNRLQIGEKIEIEKTRSSRFLLRNQGFTGMLQSFFGHYWLLITKFPTCILGHGIRFSPEQLLVWIRPKQALKCPKQPLKCPKPKTILIFFNNLAGLVSENSLKSAN